MTEIQFYQTGLALVWKHIHVCTLFPTGLATTNCGNTYKNIGMLLSMNKESVLEKE